jgi:DNA mismatch repair protein MutS
LIERAIVDEPPMAIKEGGLIRKGYHAELDELRAAAHDGKQWIAELQAREIERTGIKSLKIRFNNVFGYFIEITKSNLAQVPADYVRKQTVVNGERFVTPELKECENKILGAEDKSVALEYELFLDLRAQVVAHVAAIQQTAAAVAELDVLAAFAERALTCRYVRPKMTAPAPSSSATAAIRSSNCSPNRAGSSPTTSSSTTSTTSSSSSPVPTWPANPPTSARSPSS